ncbi:hypothetical protein, partial [Escherichia coli]|uniref:hypothetical protein n=1 Tax=Escherichia coli TaxID=562 RepID=UPI003079AB11
MSIDPAMQLEVEPQSSTYQTMVMDAAGPQFNFAEPEEEPNAEARKFYDMLDAVDKPLWPGCSNHSQLSVVARLLSWKAENNISEKGFD